MGTDFEPKERTLQERLQQAILNHQASEDPAMELYRRAVDNASDPMIKLVLAGILKDEERHHEEMATIALRLARPSPKSEGEKSVHELNQAELNELIEHEEYGATRLHALADEYVSVDGGLTSLLLHGMASDSQRHEQMLRYVLARTDA